MEMLKHNILADAFKKLYTCHKPVSYNLVNILSDTDDLKEMINIMADTIINLEDQLEKANKTIVSLKQNISHLDPIMLREDQVFIDMSKLCTTSLTNPMED